MYSPILTENSEHFCGVFVLWLLGSRIAHLSLGSHTSGAARGWEKEEDTQAEVRDTEHGIGIDATLSSKLYFKGICTRVHKGSSARRSPFNCVLIVCSFSSCRAKIRFYPADNPWLCFFSQKLDYHWILLLLFASLLLAIYAMSRNWVGYLHSKYQEQCRMISIHGLSTLQAPKHLKTRKALPTGLDQSCNL